MYAHVSKPTIRPCPYQPIHAYKIANKSNRRLKFASARGKLDNEREPRLEKSFLTILLNLKRNNIRSSCNRDIIIYVSENFCEAEARERILPKHCDETGPPSYDYIMARELADSNGTELIVSEALFKEGLIRMRNDCTHNDDFRGQIIAKTSFDSLYTSGFKTNKILGCTDLSRIRLKQPELLQVGKSSHSFHGKWLGDSGFRRIPKKFQKLTGSTQRCILGAYLKMQEFLTGVNMEDNMCLLRYSDECGKVSCSFVAVTNKEFLERSSRMKSSSKSAIVLLEILARSTRKTYAVLDKEFMLEFELGEPIVNTFDFWTFSLKNNSYLGDSRTDRFFNWQKCDFNHSSVDRDQISGDKCRRNKPKSILTEAIDEILDGKLNSTVYTKTIIRLSFEKGVINLSTGITLNVLKQKSKLPLFFLQFGTANKLLPIFQENLGERFRTIEESRLDWVCKNIVFQENRRIGPNSKFMTDLKNRFVNTQRLKNLGNLRVNWNRFVHKLWNEKARRIEMYESYDDFVRKSEFLEESINSFL